MRPTLPSRILRTAPPSQLCRAHPPHLSIFPSTPPKSPRHAPIPSISSTPINTHRILRTAPAISSMPPQRPPKSPVPTKNLTLSAPRSPLHPPSPTNDFLFFTLLTPILLPLRPPSRPRPRHLIHAPHTPAVFFMLSSPPHPVPIMPSTPLPAQTAHIHPT